VHDLTLGGAELVFAGAITPMVAGPSAVPKAIDLTVPSKYSLTLNMGDSSEKGLMLLL
jgi:hypothetical protein